MEGPSTTEPPLANFQRVLPLLASRATMSPERDGAKTTPLATDICPVAPAARAVLSGFWPEAGTCHSILPVRAFSAAQEPAMEVWPLGKVYGRRSLLLR